MSKRMQIAVRQVFAKYPSQQDETIAEICEIAGANVKAMAFVDELAGYFDATSVVLILRFAVKTGVLT